MGVFLGCSAKTLEKRATSKAPHFPIILFLFCDFVWIQWQTKRKPHTQALITRSNSNLKDRRGVMAHWSSALRSRKRKLSTTAAESSKTTTGGRKPSDADRALTFAALAFWEPHEESTSWAFWDVKCPVSGDPPKETIWVSPLGFPLKPPKTWLLLGDMLFILAYCGVVVEIQPLTC